MHLWLLVSILFSGVDALNSCPLTCLFGSVWAGVITSLCFILVSILAIIVIYRRRSHKKQGARRPDPLFRSRCQLSPLSALLAQVRQDKQVFGDIEELLVTSDFGIRATEKLISKLRENGDGEPRLQLRHEIQGLLLERTPPFLECPTSFNRPGVIMVVGVNGVGKTTTIGKLAEFYRKRGHSPILIAADTFRSAAIDQLRIWAERSNSGFFSKAEGDAPSGVVFDGLLKAKASNSTIAFVDSAGRLHTKTPLMDELAKTKRVMNRVLPGAPDEVWMVIDATLGQNTFAQVREFHKHLELTGLILTKIDGTSRGGIAVSVCEEFNVPILFLGTGESLSDLEMFSAATYADQLLGL